MLKRFFVSGTICFLIGNIIGCSTPNKTIKTDGEGFQEIETFLQSLIDTAGIPGIAIAITNGQEILYTKGFGVTNVNTKEKLEPHHIFHIASISKTFTATAVMQLYEKGKIDINKPLVTYLPYFKLKDDRYKIITIKQMLNHTSGMPDVEDYEWEKATSDEGAAERYTRSLMDSTLISNPGSEYHYSNIAYDIMADLIAKVSGMSFEKYVKENHYCPTKNHQSGLKPLTGLAFITPALRPGLDPETRIQWALAHVTRTLVKENILIPLEMNESSFYAPEIKKSLRTSPHTGNPPGVSSVYPYNRMHAPSSTLNTNVLEMSHWAMANLNDGHYKAAQILSAPMHSMMMTPTFTINKERKISMGLSWFMYSYQGMMNYEHGGGDLGYSSLLTLIPEMKIGIIILCNSEEIRIYDTRNKIRSILLSKYNKSPSQ